MNGNNNQLVRQDMGDLMHLGKVLAQSGMFKDATQEAQAVVKVLAGAELGFGPIASMTGINVIQGRVTLSANLIAAAIKRSGRYTYRVTYLDDDGCELAFFERERGGAWEQIGVSEFTRDHAIKAKTQNLDKFARNMFFARAISNGAKWFCPDIFGGPVYTPDELGAEVDGETGEAVSVPVVEVEPAPVVETPQDKELANAIEKVLTLWKDATGLGVDLPQPLPNSLKEARRDYATLHAALKAQVATLCQQAGVASPADSTPLADWIDAGWQAADAIDAQAEEVN